MAINFCTIGSTTIDGFCGNQRAKVLARLVEQKFPVVQPPSNPIPGGSGDYGGMPNFGYTNPWYDPFSNKCIDNTVESSTVTVTVWDFLDMEGTETQERNLQMEFVTVTDLQIELAPDEDEDQVFVQVRELVIESLTVSVNIRDLEM